MCVYMEPIMDSWPYLVKCSYAGWLYEVVPKTHVKESRGVLHFQISSNTSRHFKYCGNCDKTIFFGSYIQLLGRQAGQFMSTSWGASNHHLLSEYSRFGSLYGLMARKSLRKLCVQTVYLIMSYLQYTCTPPHTCTCVCKGSIDLTSLPLASYWFAD